LVAEKKFSLEVEVYPRLVAEKQIGCFITKKRFFDIRTLQRLENMRKILESS
jgi:NDP-sugar pyrophosphorylase family protein